jgi:hypothetical protein
MIEMMLAVVLTSLIVGSATTMYSFIAIRTADAVSRFSTLQSCTTLSSTMRTLAMTAVKVESKNLSGRSALVCTVPKDSVDRDGDGVPEYPQADFTDKLLREGYTEQKRIWLYPADSIGTPGSSGNYWFMAIRTDDSNPTIADIKRDWSFWRAGEPRVSIPGTVTFSVIASSRLAGVRIQTNAEETTDGGLANVRQPARLDIRHRFYWRGAQ